MDYIDFDIIEDNKKQIFNGFEYNKRGELNIYSVKKIPNKSINKKKKKKNLISYVGHLIHKNQP